MDSAIVNGSNTELQERRQRSWALDTNDGLLVELRALFDVTKKAPGRMRAEALLATAPFTLNPGTCHAYGTMRDRLTPQSYRAICEVLGAEIERLECQIERLKRADVIIASLEAANRSAMRKSDIAAE